ncbi:MAG: hypothetical protein ABI977_21835 [Acidobacteriota bacterium]
MNFQIDLARQDDDAAIRRLLATNAVPGRVTVTYEREPNYFAGCATMGRSCQVLVARQPAGIQAFRQIVGVACRATRPIFVNGEEVNLGYLGQLRIDEAARGRWLVSRGFRFLKQLHEDDPVPAYLMSVIEENREAFGVLVERRRPGFPIFRDLGRLFTLALALMPSKRAKAETLSNCVINQACQEDLPDIVAFLRQYGAARQFFPAYREEDFGGDATHDFSVEDFFIARCHSEIAGVIGLWDQSSYKQTRVRGYAGWLRRARPVYNVVAKLLARPQLPSLGEKISYAYASFVCIADDDPEVFSALLQRIYGEAAERGYSYLMIGFDERDPLLKIARSYSHIAYRSRIFLAGWNREANIFERFYEQLDDRIPYVEIAAL